MSQPEAGDALENNKVAPFPAFLEMGQPAQRAKTLIAMAAMTDGLNQLFSNDVAPVRALRDFGLGLVDRAGPVKEALIRTASGVGNAGPKLLRGLPI